MNLRMFNAFSYLRHGLVGLFRDYWQDVASGALRALNFNSDAQSYDARSSKHFVLNIFPIFP